MKKLLVLLSSLMFWRPQPKKPVEVKSYTSIPMDSLLIRIINPESDMLNEALGITEERLDELGDTIQKTLDKHHKETGGIPASLEELTPMFKHPNEIVYAGIIIGSWYEHNKRMNMISKMFGKKD